ncbi:MAG: hypothetical protein Q4G64_03995 [bacterium]|nr:hypothetical protein [bacterium]
MNNVPVRGLGPREFGRRLYRLLVSFGLPATIDTDSAEVAVPEDLAYRELELAHLLVGEFEKRFMIDPRVDEDAPLAETGPCVGLVREWHPEEGWGAVDVATAPGGCFVHFSHLGEGLRASELTVGVRVSLRMVPYLEGPELYIAEYPVIVAPIA